MKRACLLLLSVLLLYAGIRFFQEPVYTDEAEMLRAISREMKLDEAASRDFTVASAIVSGDGRELLLICQLGEWYAPRYSAWRFNIVGEHRYTLEKTEIIADTDVPDISHMTWDDRYIVLVNNPEVDKYIAIIDGEEETGTIKGIPQTLEFVGRQIEVNFYDNAGNRLSG